MVWKPVHRIVHLPGGLRALNRTGPAVWMDIGEGFREREVLRTRDYDALYVDVARLGVLPVGVTIVGSREEQEGHEPASFRSLDVGARIPWPCGYQADQWGALSHTALAAGHRYLGDVASRVSHELSTCDELVFGLSEAYLAQRLAVLRKGRSPGDIFVDGFTPKIHQVFEAFLTRAATLRDHLAEFYASTWHGVKAGGAPAATKISGVLKALKACPQHDAFAAELLAATGEGGWLRVLGAYRDLVVHSASISRADGTLPATVMRIALKNGSTPLTVKMPLPDSPDKIAARRASGEIHSAPPHRVQSFSSAASEGAVAHDMLDYAAASLRKLAGLAAIALTLSPVEPRMPELGPAEIIEVTVSSVEPPR